MILQTYQEHRAPKWMVGGVDPSLHQKSQTELQRLSNSMKVLAKKHSFEASSLACHLHQTIHLETSLPDSAPPALNSEQPPPPSSSDFQNMKPESTHAPHRSERHTQSLAWCTEHMDTGPCTDSWKYDIACICFAGG